MSRKQDISQIQLQIEQVTRELRKSAQQSRATSVALTHLDTAQLWLLKESVESVEPEPKEPKKDIVIQDPCDVEPLASAPWYIRYAMGCFGS